MGKPGILDLEKHFAFYGSYHRSSMNVLIHTLFVWPIFLTSLVLFYFAPAPRNICPCGVVNTTLFLNLGFFITVLYALFYVCLDKKAGFLAALLCFACYVSSRYLASHLGFSRAWKVVLATQAFCWTGQFIGHGLFEKRAPAFIKNIVQAFLMAPFFVLLEALHLLFGYEPYPGFHARVKTKIEAADSEWKDNGIKKDS